MDVVDQLRVVWRSRSVWKRSCFNTVLSTIRSTANTAPFRGYSGFSTVLTAYYYYCFCYTKI